MLPYKNVSVDLSALIWAKNRWWPITVLLVRTVSKCVHCAYHYLIASVV